MKNGKVSVIIPVYNGEKTISRTLDSLLMQTYKNWDVLAVNDGSSDKSIDILKEYEKRYSDKIIVFSHDNIGQAETRNKAINEADGEYVMFVDADDYVDTDYIECYVNAIESGDYDCVVGGFRREDEHGKIVKRFKPENIWTMYANMGVCSRIIKRKLLLDNNIKYLDISIGEDAYFNFSVFAKTNKVKFIQNEGYVWFLNHNSISFREHGGFTVTSEIFDLLNNLSGVIDMSDELNQAWLVRYVVWYLLFSGRRAASDELIETDKELFEWLEARHVRLKFPVRGVTEGETFKIRFCVSTYLILRRCRLLKVFARLYCKSK